jgi:hypothetical protein
VSRSINDLVFFLTNTFVGVSMKVDSLLARSISTLKDLPAFRSQEVSLSELHRRFLVVLSALPSKPLLSLPERCRYLSGFSMSDSGYCLVPNCRTRCISIPRARKVKDFKMIRKETFTILLGTICYDTRRAWRKDSAVWVVGLPLIYTCDTSECFHLMGLGHLCRISPRCT